tara:strand:- start:3649 stop:4668 length:1020 start_codon:yes stop_codon:yes gene_type:complete
MGAIWFAPKSFADTLSEKTGYKAGIALSIEEMCDLLSDTTYADDIISSERGGIRIRAEDLDDLFYKLLHRVGHTDEEFNGDIIGAGLIHKYRGTALENVYMGVCQLFVDVWPQILEEAEKTGKRSLDPTTYFDAARAKYGIEGAKIAIEKIEIMDKGIRLSPNNFIRYTEWDDVAKLSALFEGSKDKPKHGSFIDQRFINYLHKNFEKLGEIHWRKFEELTAEFFDRSGFRVEIGPGRNDDGVDVRVWQPNQVEKDSPHIIIQCKRQKAKVEKVIVKGLYADIAHNKANLGLIVTSSELSPGARDTISARSYPIQEINNSEIFKWLAALRVPGAGIVRV